MLWDCDGNTNDDGIGSWWGRDDTGRMVASVVAAWNGVDRWAWLARWWGDRPPDALGLSLGRDTTIVAEDLDDAHAAMAAVEAHIAARDPPRLARGSPGHCSRPSRSCALSVRSMTTGTSSSLRWAAG